MSNSNLEKNKKSAIKKYAFFSILSFVLLFVLLAFFSAIMVALDIDKGFIPFLTAFSLAFSTLIGAYFLGKIFTSKALIVGSVNGVIIYLFVSLVSAILSDGKISLASLFNLLIIFLSSVIGAVLGVNSANKRKIK
jgi:putative membrane protein (TIGR04086 family)